MCTLNPPSQEQSAVVDAAKTHRGIIIINAVAGSGKTTTALHIAKNTSDKILLLTYNSKLRLETAHKAAGVGVANIEVHTYHSFIKNATGSDCYDDDGLRRYLAADNTSGVRDKVGDIGLIIADEFQDATPLLARVLASIIRATSRLRCVIFVGDVRQEIYGYNGADARYLTMSHDIFAGIMPAGCDKVLRFDLSKSYRVTRSVADFINTCLGADSRTVRRIVSDKNGPPPVLHIAKSTTSDAVKIIRDAVKRYSVDDIMVLAQSVKFLHNIANSLAKMKYLVYMPNDDQSDTSREVLARGKLLFLSFHQSKGLERKFVVVVGVDGAYIRDGRSNAAPTIINRDEDRAISSVTDCPNVFYVALTRAQEELVMIAQELNGPPNFIDLSVLSSAGVTIVGSFNEEPKERTGATPAIGVTAFLRSLPDRLMNQCITLPGIEFKPITEIPGIGPLDDVEYVYDDDYVESDISTYNSIQVNMCSEVKCHSYRSAKYIGEGKFTKKRYTESVSAINGRMIPIAWAINRGLAPEPAIDRVIIEHDGCTICRFYKCDVCSALEKSIAAAYERAQSDDRTQIETEFVRPEVKCDHYPAKCKRSCDKHKDAWSKSCAECKQRSCRRFLLEEYIRKHKIPILNNDSIKPIAKAAIVYDSLESNLILNIMQITNYKWAALNDVKTAVKKLDSIINRWLPRDGKGDVFVEYPRERELPACIGSKYSASVLRGVYDVYSKSPSFSSIIELKLVNRISASHKLQLILYAYINLPEITSKYVLLNLKGGEIFELNATPDALELVVRLILCYKSHPAPRYDDAAFLKYALTDRVNTCKICGLDVVI